jgi:hypothetical protein
MRSFEEGGLSGVGSHDAPQAQFTAVSVGRTTSVLWIRWSSSSIVHFVLVSLD